MTIRWTDPASDLPPGMVCPGCEAEFPPVGTGGFVSSGQMVRLLGRRITDYVGAESPESHSILALPGGSLAELRDGLLAVRAGDPSGEDPFAVLQALRLADGFGTLTDLGVRLAYHLAEHQRQAYGLWPASVDDRFSVGPGAEPLDVGCGAGPALHLLGAARRVGVGVALDPGDSARPRL